LLSESKRLISDGLTYLVHRKLIGEFRLTLDSAIAQSKIWSPLIAETKIWSE